MPNPWTDSVRRGRTQSRRGKWHVYPFDTARDSPDARTHFPERPGRRHLGNDLLRPEARRFNVGDRVVGHPALFLVEIEDRRAIARPDVVALAIQRRRIVDLEEEVPSRSRYDLLGVEDDLDGSRRGAAWWSRHAAVARSPSRSRPSPIGTPGRFRMRSCMPQKHPPARIAFSTPSTFGHLLVQQAVVASIRRRRPTDCRARRATSQAGPGIAPSASLIRVQTFMLTTTPTISRISSG